jgi:hypothetical protein
VRTLAASWGILCVDLHRILHPSFSILFIRFRSLLNLFDKLLFVIIGGKFYCWVHGTVAPHADVETNLVLILLFNKEWLFSFYGLFYFRLRVPWVCPVAHGRSFPILGRDNW